MKFRRVKVSDMTAIAQEEDVIFADEISTTRISKNAMVGSFKAKDAHEYFERMA